MVRGGYRTPGPVRFRQPRPLTLQEGQRARAQRRQQQQQQVRHQTQQPQQQERQRHSGGGGGRPAPAFVGLILLAYNVVSALVMDKITPVTLGFIAVQTTIFLGCLMPGFDPNQVANICLNANAVAVNGEWARVMAAPLVHASDVHLFYNMLSLLMKGPGLEKRFGSLAFFWLLIFFMVTTGFVYVALALVTAKALKNPDYANQCVVGFSAVLFALKVLADHYESKVGETVNHFGYQIPKRLATWSELIIISLMVPQASFLGHLAGILCGFAFLACAFPFGWARTSARPTPTTIGTEGMFGTARAALPAASLAVSGALAALHSGLLSRPWRTRSFWMSGPGLVCLSARRALSGAAEGRGDLLRVVSAPLEHEGGVHLATSIFSLIMKGYQLEPLLGPLGFSAAVASSSLLSGLAYVLSALGAEAATGDPSYATECVLGLSGALFALKVACLGAAKSLFNPTALFELTELLILLEPRTRLLHLSGLLSGLLLHRTWWKDRISGSCFPGEGVRLGGDDREDGEGPRRQEFQVRGASREKWTRSWGYAGYRPTPTPSNRLRVSRGGGGGGGGVATPLRESASFEPGGDVGRSGGPRGGDSSATTSPGSSSLARASIDSESDRDDGEDIFAARRSPRRISTPPPAPRRVTRASVRRSLMHHQQQQEHYQQQVQSVVRLRRHPPSPVRPSVHGTPPPPPPRGLVAVRREGLTSSSSSSGDSS